MVGVEFRDAEDGRQFAAQVGRIAGFGIPEQRTGGLDVARQVAGGIHTRLMHALQVAKPAEALLFTDLHDGEAPLIARQIVRDAVFEGSRDSR